MKSPGLTVRATLAQGRMTPSVNHCSVVTSEPRCNVPDCLRREMREVMRIVPTATKPMERSMSTRMRASVHVQALHTR